MALSDWTRGVATVATLATHRPVPPSTVATVATVARGRDSADTPASVAAPANRATAHELRELVAIISAGWPADEKADALAAALADPDGALRCFRALVAERGETTRPPALAREVEPTCRSCANLSPGGRCLAAWRGESLGDGIATSRKWSPQYPDHTLRCGAYAPLPGDPDQRTGRQRWPFLFRGGEK